MATKTKINPADLGAKAQTLFDTRIKPNLASSEQSAFILIDVDSGAYEIGSDDLAIEECLLARYPKASMVLLRTDGEPTGHFGWSFGE